MQFLNQVQIKDCCYFSIPLIVTGLPADDMPHLINFLVFRLTENGLLCHYIEKSNQIYISWKEEDIDLAKYFNVKKSIENNISIVQHENISDLKSGRYAEDVLINGKKAKSAKYIQYEREKQFQKDIQGRNVQPSSFEDFVRKMGGSVG